MSKEAAGAAETAESQRAYETAVIEFNLATLPLIVALTAHMPPSTAELRREEKARSIVVDARRRAWAAASGQG